MHALDSLFSRQHSYKEQKENIMLDISTKLTHARQVLAGVEKVWHAAGGASGWTVSFSLAAINNNLSQGGITAPSLHEVYGTIGNGAATGFTLWLAELALGQTSGPVFWIKRARGKDNDALYLPALSPQLQEKLIVSEAQNQRDVLWAFEEILNSGQAACVIAEIDGMDLTTARRLQLASERGRSLALALCQTGTGQKTHNSVARTRWRARTCRGGWNLELMGGRGVRPGEWRVKQDATALSLHLVSASGDGPLPNGHQHAAA
jgi:protein ImuA